MRFEYWEWDAEKQCHVLVAEGNCPEPLDGFMLMWRAMTK